MRSGRMPTETPDQFYVRRITEERDRLREALLALVDVMPYLHPNPNALHARKWRQWREEALDKAAAALGPEVDESAD